MICISFNDVNVTENRRLVGTGQNGFYFVLSSSVESWTPTYMSSYILENFLLFKLSFIIGQFLLFFASEEEKKSYKKFYRWNWTFYFGQYDKIARSGFIVPLKLRKICNPLSNYSPAKTSNNNSYNLYKCFDNHPIKITSGFWIASSLNSVSVQLSDISLGSLRLYKSI